MSGSKENHHAAPSTWSDRCTEPDNKRVTRVTGSIFFARRRALQDIAASLAHVRMLAAQGIIAAYDLADIQRGLSTVREEILGDRFEWSLDAEDVQLNIE